MLKELDIVIEVPMGSNIKYEWDVNEKVMKVDRILRKDFVYPANYGFVPETLDWDGDPLDILVFSPEVFPPGVVMKVRLLGAMKMIDDGETDTKLIAVHADDYRLNDIQSFDDIPNSWLKNIEYFFSSYKNWKRPGITSVPGFVDANVAGRELSECSELYSKYKTMDKKAFIAQMKKARPEKYPA